MAIFPRAKIGNIRQKNNVYVRNKTGKEWYPAIWQIG